MKTVLFKIAPYVLAFIMLNIICYHYSGFYKQEQKYVDRIETTIGNQSETIFLGDSHVETIKLLDLPESIGNLAFGADGIYEMYIKVLIMLKYNKELKNVFIATEPQLFNNTGSSNSTFLGNYLLKVEDSLNVYNKSKLNLITDQVPLFNDGYIGFVLNSIYDHFRPEAYSSKPEWSTLSDSERQEKATATGISDHRDLMKNEDFLMAYRALVNLCKTNNIKVIGVRFPVNANYINQCSPKDFEKVESFIESLELDKHLDYSTRITKPIYFDDEDHLNSKGIQMLSTIIESDTGIKITD